MPGWENSFFRDSLLISLNFYKKFESLLSKEIFLMNHLHDAIKNFKKKRLFSSVCFSSIMVRTEIDEIKDLCDHCLGRIYAMEGHGLSNKDRGMAIRVIYAMEHDMSVEDLYPENCTICGNIFDNVEKFAELIIKELNKFEFQTFLIGSRVDFDTMEKDEKLREKYGGRGEKITNELDREIGKIVSEKIKKDVSFNDPEITAIIDVTYEYVELKIKPIFIYGRYRKLVRGIPQTKWIKGKGEMSIEDMVGEICKKNFLGQDYVFHGEGREDVDVRMLGNGRPFIIEIKNPIKRNVDLKIIEDEINETFNDKVNVKLLKYVSRKDVSKLKERRSRKKYVLKISFEENIDPEKVLKILSEFQGKVIYQRTPLRVLKRRADLVRERRIYSIKAIEIGKSEITLEIVTDPGLYVKEFVHGDQGRTRPNLAEMFGGKIKIESLDVVEIETED